MCSAEARTLSARRAKIHELQTPTLAHPESFPDYEIVFRRRLKSSILYLSRRASFLPNSRFMKLFATMSPPSLHEQGLIGGGLLIRRLVPRNSEMAAPAWRPGLSPLLDQFDSDAMRDQDAVPRPGYPDFPRGDALVDVRAGL